MQNETNTHKESPLSNLNKIININPSVFNTKREKGLQVSNYSNSFLNKLIHKLGHDLRSPVFVAKSYSQLLLKTQEPQRLQRGLGMIAESTIKMERLINSLVELIDIYTLAMPSLELLLIEDAFKKAKLKLFSDLDSADPQININFKSYPVVRFPKSYLIDIFNELVGNAIKHNPDNSNLHIYIRTFKENNNLVLEIKDNGIGIDDLDDKYFDPFYSRSENERFTGVGLSKVQAIAKMVGGSIHLQNQSDGGLTCRFYF